MSLPPLLISPPYGQLLCQSLLRRDYPTATDNCYPHYCDHPTINHCPVTIPILLPHDYRTAASDSGGGGGRIFAHLIPLSLARNFSFARDLSHTQSLSHALRRATRAAAAAYKESSPHTISLSLSLNRSHTNNLSRTYGDGRHGRRCKGQPRQK